MTTLSFQTAGVIADNTGIIYYTLADNLLVPLRREYMALWRKPQQILNRIEIKDLIEAFDVYDINSFYLIDNKGEKYYPKIFTAIVELDLYSHYGTEDVDISEFTPFALHVHNRKTLYYFDHPNILLSYKIYLNSLIVEDLARV